MKELYWTFQNLSYFIIFKLFQQLNYRENAIMKLFLLTPFLFFSTLSLSAPLNQDASHLESFFVVDINAQDLDVQSYTKRINQVLAIARKPNTIIKESYCRMSINSQLILKGNELKFEARIECSIYKKNAKILKLHSHQVEKFIVAKLNAKIPASLKGQVKFTTISRKGHPSVRSSN